VLSRGYGENSFKEDMKRMYYLLGLEGKQVVFLFTQSQIIEEGTYYKFALEWLNTENYSFLELFFVVFQASSSLSTIF